MLLGAEYQGEQGGDQGKEPRREEPAEEGPVGEAPPEPAAAGEEAPAVETPAVEAPAVEPTGIEPTTDLVPEAEEAGTPEPLRDDEPEPDAAPPAAAPEPVWPAAREEPAVPPAQTDLFPAGPGPAEVVPDETPAGPVVELVAESDTGTDDDEPPLFSALTPVEPEPEIEPEPVAPAPARKKPAKKKAKKKA